MADAAVSSLLGDRLLPAARLQRGHLRPCRHLRSEWPHRGQLGAEGAVGLCSLLPGAAGIRPRRKKKKITQVLILRRLLEKGTPREESMGRF